VTRYRRVENGYTFPDGGRVASWSCGSPGCHVKLLSGNKAVDRLTRPEVRR
jgi:hypothetical protein